MEDRASSRWQAGVRLCAVLFAALLIIMVVVHGLRTTPRGEVDYVLRTLRRVHPAVADGFSAQQQALIDRVHARLGDTMSDREHVFMIRELLCMLSDAHTSLWMDPQDTYFDLPLIWLAGGLFVVGDAGPLEAGDEVLSLGGLTPGVILDELARYVPAENRYWVRVRGELILARQSWLDQLGALNDDGSLTVEARRDAETVTINLRGVSGTVRPSIVGSPGRHWVGWHIDEELPLGVFHLDSCRPGGEYDRALESFFEAVAAGGIETVVLDLRYNPGGDSRVLDQFITRLDVDTYRHMGGQVRWSWPVVGQRFGLHTILRTLSPGMDVFEPRTVANAREEPSFSGELYVLTSARTFSSGTMFALVLSDSGLATVVGEPTGGAPSCYGDILRFTLPRSGLGFTVSYKHFIRPDPSRDPAESLYPDVPVETTIDDYLEGRDPQLEYVRELLRAGVEGDG